MGLEKTKIREAKEAKTGVKVAPTVTKQKAQIKRYLDRAKRIKEKLSKIPAFVVDIEAKEKVAGLKSRLNILEGKLTTLAKKVNEIEGERNQEIDGAMREIFGLMALPIPRLTIVWPHQKELYKEVRGNEAFLARTEKGEKYLRPKGDQYVVEFGGGKKGERAERKTKIQHLIPKQKYPNTKILITGKGHGGGEEAEWKVNTWKNMKTQKRVFVYNGNKVKKIA